MEIEKKIDLMSKEIDDMISEINDDGDVDIKVVKDPSLYNFLYDRICNLKEMGFDKDKIMKELEIDDKTYRKYGGKKSEVENKKFRSKYTGLDNYMKQDLFYKIERGFVSEFNPEYIEFVKKTLDYKIYSRHKNF